MGEPLPCPHPGLPGTRNAFADALRAQAATLLALAEALSNPPSEFMRDELVWIGACGIERRAVERLISSGKLRSTKQGRKVYVLRSELLALVETAAAPRAPKARYTLADGIAARGSHGRFKAGGLGPPSEH